MNLRYIALHMDSDSGYKDPLKENFNLNTRFINNYLSIQIRTLKIPTDDTFNMISVCPSIDIKYPCRIVGDKALESRVSFDKTKYEGMNEFEQYEYYLQLLEEGYKICANEKKIPLKELLELHQVFRNNGYKNEWVHKKKKIKDQNLEVILACFFTSTDFRLQMFVYDIKNKKELVSGTVIRTVPKEVSFDPLFKDVIIEENNLIITEYQNRPKFKFLLSDILKGKFSFEVTKVGLEYKPIA